MVFISLNLLFLFVIVSFSFPPFFVSFPLSFLLRFKTAAEEYLHVPPKMYFFYNNDELHTSLFPAKHKNISLIF